MKSMDQSDPLVTPTSPAKPKPDKKDEGKKTPWPYPTGKPPRPGLVVGEDGKWKFVPPAGWVGPNRRGFASGTQGYKDINAEKNLNELFASQYLQQPITSHPTFSIGDVVAWKNAVGVYFVVVGFKEFNQTTTIVCASIADGGKQAWFSPDELFHVYRSLPKKEEKSPPFKEIVNNHVNPWHEVRPPKEGWYMTKRNEGVTAHCDGDADERKLFWRENKWFLNENDTSAYSNINIRVWRACDGTPHTAG